MFFESKKVFAMYSGLLFRYEGLINRLSKLDILGNVSFGLSIFSKICLCQ